MSGVCTPVVNGMSIINSNSEGISIHFNQGERWKFKQNTAHKDLLTLTKGEDICLVMSVSQFYHDFKIIERGE